MYSNTARYGLLMIIIHWIVVLLLVILFGVGWYIQTMPQASPARSFLLDFHISLGLTSAIFVSVQIALRIVFKAPPFPESVPLWEQKLTGLLYLLIYILLILMPVAGYLQTVFSARPVYFWNIPIPFWGVMDINLAAFFQRLHGAAAWILSGLILLHIGLVVFNTLNGNRMASRMLGGAEEETSTQMVPAETAAPASLLIVHKFVKNLRIFGWLGFWLQFVLAFIAGLLLIIAAPGLAFSPNAIGAGDAMNWASYGFLLLCVSVLTALYYIRAAGKIRSRPDAYLPPQKKVGFWFLGGGMLSGGFGILLAFGGMFLSLSMLVGKTVSQPPGIAITDPQRIIRALDVFILMVNFDLLLAHFIGAGISFWLSLQAAKARLEYGLMGISH
ncbi:MAG: DUF3611 family protein [Gammaproteobacteria bacterium]